MNESAEESICSLALLRLLRGRCSGRCLSLGGGDIAGRGDRGLVFGGRFRVSRRSIGLLG